MPSILSMFMCAGGAPALDHSDGSARRRLHDLLRSHAPTISIEVFNPAYCNLWLHAYCFGRLKHARLDQIDLDGISTLATSCSQMVAQLSANSSKIVGFGAPVITAMLHYTRVLEMKGGATIVIG